MTSSAIPVWIGEDEAWTVRAVSQMSLHGASFELLMCGSREWRLSPHSGHSDAAIVPTKSPSPLIGSAN